MGYIYGIYIYIYIHIYIYIYILFIGEKHLALKYFSVLSFINTLQNNMIRINKIICLALETVSYLNAHV